jgi:hypothetical protein
MVLHDDESTGEYEIREEVEISRKPTSARHGNGSISKEGSTGDARAKGSKENGKDPL